MLVVATELRPSAIQGSGVFLLDAVKKGNLVWCFDTRLDRVYSPNELDTLPPLNKEYIEKYASWHIGTSTWILYGDHTRFINHARQASLLSLGIGYGNMIAARDLSIGEELTVEYSTICDYPVPLDYKTGL